MPKTTQAQKLRKGTEIRLNGMTLTVLKARTVGPYTELDLSNGSTKRIYFREHVLLA